MKTLIILITMLFATAAFGQGLEDRVTALETRADETDVEQGIQDADIADLDVRVDALESAPLDEGFIVVDSLDVELGLVVDIVNTNLVQVLFEVSGTSGLLVRVTRSRISGGRISFESSDCTGQGFINLDPPDRSFFAPNHIILDSPDGAGNNSIWVADTSGSPVFVDVGSELSGSLMTPVCVVSGGQFNTGFPVQHVTDLLTTPPYSFQ